MTNSTSSPALPDRTTILAFAIFVIVSGGASVAIRFTYAELPPFWGGVMRFAFGAIFFWAVVLIRKLELPKGKALTGAILFGVFSMGLPFLFIYWGLVKTPASLYQTVIALVPLLTIFFAFFHGLEPFRPIGLLGAGLTVVGIVVAVGGAPEGTLSIPHILAIIAGAACFAEAGIIAKSFPRNNPYVTNAVAMPVGALILFIGSGISGEKIVIPSQATTWFAFGYIVIFVTIIAFLLYLFVLQRWTASGTSYSFVLIPLVTVVVASWLANEQITGQFLIGGALVLLGVWIGALMPAKSQ
ncbi:MAG TPA: EamA family transporter [Anaerolineales bacterium]|nr:EamA family transporter [Anaerolineales bacterium]